MIRKQIYIDDDLDASLKLLAVKTGQSEAAHVREALRKYIEQVRDGLIQDNDAFAGVAGMVDDPNLPTDIADQHDHYLYGSRKTPPSRARRTGSSS